MQPCPHNPRWVLSALLALAVGACGGNRGEAPLPGQQRGTPPILSGRTVLMLPVQQVVGVRGDVDAELAFTLTDRGRDIDWIRADSVDAMLARSPGIDARTRGLPVGQFHLAEVRRIGDPLFGEIRRMATLVDADAVLLPVAATFEPNPDIINGVPRVRLMMTIIEPRTGQVVWFGIEEGGDFEVDDPRGLASAVENMARTLLWYVGGAR